MFDWLVLMCVLYTLVVEVEVGVRAAKVSTPLLLPVDDIDNVENARIEDGRHCRTLMLLNIPHSSSVLTLITSILTYYYRIDVRFIFLSQFFFSFSFSRLPCDTFDLSFRLCRLSSLVASLIRFFDFFSISSFFYWVPLKTQHRELLYHGIYYMESLSAFVKVQIWNK